ncbi:MAG: choice-of-anchor D domain-containing protein [Deltaproteobacteria bacterium]|nr:choice-of-anchor D domain-containing protein [Deltaproteobacteria bacterium]
MAPRPFPIFLIAATVAFSACGDGEEKPVYYDYPKGVFSTQTVDFGSTDQGTSVVRQITLTNQGDLSMGIASIETGVRDRSSEFTVSWTRLEITCPDGGEQAEAAEARRYVLDSGAGETGEEDTGEDETGPIALVLDPGCTIPIHLSYTANQLGEVWGSLIVETVEETQPDTAPASWTPAYYADPTNQRRVVYLKGEAERGIPNIVVSPRRYDFGNVWSGREEKAFFSVRNLGDGTLTIRNVYLSPTSCDEAYSITNAEDGLTTTLEPDESTFVEVTFAPTDLDEATCRLYVESDDEDSPSISVPLQGNIGLDPSNRPPTVRIRDPIVGYQHAGHQPFQIELNVYDVNQPATSLTCRLKSMVLRKTETIADCTPPDDSGHVYVSIDPDDIGVGNDTFRVQVTDGNEEVAYASIAVLLNASFPESDDDGDGWGDEWDADTFGNFDCDDHEINVYPFAAELADHMDNDCDGVVDEGTVLSDDDGDGFSENDGDCNDLDVAIYPGAVEVTDDKDNNCDGNIDEGTSVYDDDGDGFSELDGDCDDENPEINPGATEYCDGVDNNCNGLLDYADGCIDLNSLPYIVGGIRMEQTACESGDRIGLSVFVFDADGQAIDYAWSGDQGVGIEPTTGSPQVTVTCPTVADNIGSAVKSLYVVATDEDANSVWDFAELTVYPEGDLYRPLTRTVTTDEGCSTSGGSGAGRGFSIAALALLAAVLRRRRSR